MGSRRIIAAILAALICLATPGISLARGELDNPWTDPLPDPNDTACPESAWPHYYYRLPVIFQYTTDAGTLDFFAFGYADGCKHVTAQKTRGGTHANIQLLEGVWADDIMDRYAALNAQAQPLTQGTLLPGLAYPGDNAYRWPLPPIRLEYHTLYNDQKTRCRYRADDPELICPGLPPEAAALLTQAGFTQDKKTGRYLIDLSFIEGAQPQAVAGWFLSGLSTQPPNPSETFYARHWGTYNRDAHSDGGLFRIILFPVDLALTGLPAETKIRPDGTALVKANVSLSGKQVPTWVGWRIKGGDPTWHRGRAFGRNELAPGAAVNADFEITGVQPGQTIEVMVNPDRSVAEVTGNPAADAYADNLGETLLIPGGVDLEVVSVSSPAQVAYEAGGKYKVVWVIRNNSAVKATGKRTVTLASNRAGRRPLLSGGVILEPGESRTEETWVTQRGCSDQLRVTVEIAPAEGETDTNPANNAGSRTTTVGPCQETRSTQAPGNSTVQIVPDDCDVNPDPSSDQPCLNYPGLRVQR